MRRIRRAPDHRVGLVALVLMSALIYLGFTKDIPFVGEPWEVKAAFVDGSGLAPGSPVRIAGVEVGEVTAVEHTRPGARTVTATLAIKDSGRPLHEDATAAIRPRIFLEGNFFVDLGPGSPDAPHLDEGDVIPAGQTSNPVQVGEVLRTLTSDTRADLKSALSSLADAQEAGAGRAFNRSLAPQGDAYRYTAVVAEALQGSEPGDLGRFVRDQGIVSAALDANPAQLRSLIENFNTTAAALADRDDELRSVIRDLGPTLEQGMLALSDLNAAFPSVRRFARASLPAVRSSRPTARALVPFLAQLRGLVRPAELRGLAGDLRALTPAAVRLAKASVGVLEESRLLGSCTYEVLVPHANRSVPDPNFPASGPVHEEFPKIFPALAGESRSFDANGQWFRVLGTGGVETFDLGNDLIGSAAAPIVGVNPPPDRTRPPLRPDAPCETQEIPNLETQQGVPPQKIENDQNSPAAVKRTAKARALAVALLQARLRQSGSDAKVRLKEATLEELQSVAAELGHAAQPAELAARSQRLMKTAAEARR